MVTKRFLIALVILGFAKGVFGQTAYNKFIVDGAGWVITENYCTELGGSCGAGDPSTDMTFADTYYYKLAGDSLIDSTYYAKLFMSFCANSCFGCGPPNGPQFYPGCGAYQLVALLYEDTVNRKVFVHNSNSTDCWNHYDSLFIDFSLAVGDSENLVYRWQYCDTNEFIVDSINQVGFQNYPRKTWRIRNTQNIFMGSEFNSFQLYEGIGYSWGFNLMYDQGDLVANYGRQLIKYCPAGDSTCQSPYRPVGINEVPWWDNSIVVKPNPASGFISINSANALISNVEILDINGRILRSFSSNQLEISALPSALYFLQIHTDRGVAYKRFVKI